MITTTHSTPLVFYPQRRLIKPMTMALNNNNADTPNFDALLKKVGAEKNRAAFSKVFEYFAPRLKSYMLKHGASDSAAEEIVQNTFVTVWEKAASFNPQKAAASTWIFTIARNKRIDALRREKYITFDSDDDALKNAVVETPEDYTETSSPEHLRKAILTLPPAQEKLLRMAFFEDKSHQQIAQETHLPLGTVKSRLRLALNKLKLILKADAP